MSDTETQANTTIDFDAYMSAERERIAAQRKELQGTIKTCQTELVGLDKRWGAIQAYRVAITGRSSSTASASGPAAPRRDSRRQALLDLIQANPNGLSRGDVLTHMGLKGNKSGEMSISNALTALTRRNAVRRDGGRYFPIETVQQGQIAA